MKKNIYKIALMAIALLAFVDPAFAAESEGSASGLVGIAAGIAVGLAALGCGLGQGKAVSSALDAIGRNPSAGGKLFVPMILGLVFMETLVILSFVIAINLAGKI